VAQPALFALGSALHELALEAGLRPGFVAGHSLGEYTAAVAAGALSPEDGLALVCERGRLMAEVQVQRPGAMGAVIGLPSEAVAELCARVGEVEPANLNTPTQTVVSGEEAAVAELLARASEAGADRAVRLQVGAAFHSRAMRPVQAAMARRMEGLAWRDPEIALAANASGTLVSTAEEVHAALVAQIASPVRWVACVEALLAAGAGSFLELGPGRVLTGLLKAIAPGVSGAAADGPEKVARQGLKLTQAV
jgi:[acyl-carrier-protein] S-malonyltransferase